MAMVTTMPRAELPTPVTPPAASTVSSIPESDGLGTSMLLAEFGPQTRPENQSRIELPSQNPGQDSWTLRRLRSGKLAVSLSVHGWRESHVTPVCLCVSGGRFVRSSKKGRRIAAASPSPWTVIAFPGCTVP